REAGDLEARDRRAFRGAREIDPRGDVLDAEIDERIVVGALMEVTAQRPGAALWMIVVSPRQAVVEEQRHAALEARAERDDPGREPETHLRGVSLGQVARRRAEHAFAGPGERRVGWPGGGQERTVLSERHAEFAQRASAHGEAPDG